MMSRRMCESEPVFWITILVLFLPSMFLAGFVALTLRREGSLDNLTPTLTKKWIVGIMAIIGIIVGCILIGVEANSETADDGCSGSIYALAGISIACLLFSAICIFINIAGELRRQELERQKEREMIYKLMLTKTQPSRPSGYHGVPMRF